MHVPDGFLDAPTSLATGAVAVAGVGVALRGARRELDDRTAPMAGLVATFIFAVQMMNFPVGAGTSGHLLGGALAAVLVGPWTGVLCISVVLLVQALLLRRRRHHRPRHQHRADGASAVGRRLAGLQRVHAVLPKRRSRWCPAAGIAAFVSVPAAAWPSSGCTPSAAPPPSRSASCSPRCSAGNTLIGIGEAAITGPRGRAASSPSAPTSSTAPARCWRSASSRSDLAGGAA